MLLLYTETIKENCVCRYIYVLLYRINVYMIHPSSSPVYTLQNNIYDVYLNFPVQGFMHTLLILPVCQSSSKLWHSIVQNQYIWK